MERLQITCNQAKIEQEKLPLSPPNHAEKHCFRLFKNEKNYTLRNFQMIW